MNNSIVGSGYLIGDSPIDLSSGGNEDTELNDLDLNEMSKTPINDSSSAGFHTRSVTMTSSQAIDIKEEAFKQSLRCHSAICENNVIFCQKPYNLT